MIQEEAAQAEETNFLGELCAGQHAPAVAQPAVVRAPVRQPRPDGELQPVLIAHPGQRGCQQEDG